MRSPSILAHIRDVLLLPVTVAGIIPYFIYSPNDNFVPDVIWVKLPGALLGLIGLTLLFYTIALFGLFGGGTLAPWQPTQKLVVSGPYQYVRNPMISGVVFILSGEGLIFHSTSILIWAALVLVINTGYFIAYEEPSLEERFGDDYVRYKESVGRWIPRLSPYRG